MKHIFTFLLALCTCAYASATTTITVDANPADWAEVPMISEPGVTPMLKMLVPQSDVTLPAGTAFAALLVDNAETTLAADGPVFYVDADRDATTGTVPWFCGNIGYEYQLASWSGASYAVDANKYEIAVKQSAFTNGDFTGEFTTWMTYKWGNAENGGYYVPATGTFSASICYPMHVRPYTFRNLEGTITPAEMYSQHKALAVTDGKIVFSGNGYEPQQWASWAVELTPGIYNVTAELEATTASSVCVELVDLVSNTVVATKNTGNLWGKTGTVTVGEWDLRDIPAGKYMLKYRNVYQYAAFSLSSLTFTYAGGAATDIPAASIALKHATVYSPKAIERDDEHIKFVESGYNTSSYIDFRINLTTPANYNVTLGISTDNGHQLQAVLQQTDGTVIATLDEGAKYTTGELSLDMGMLDMSSLAAGTYVLRVQNAKQYSNAILKSVAVTYGGGAVAVLPATILAADALFSARGSREGDYIVFPADGNLPNDYITIYASVAEAGSYQFTLHCSTTDYHQYKAIIRNRTTDAQIDVVGQAYGKNTNDVVLGTANLPEGEFVIELHQTNAWGHAKFASLEVASVDPIQHVYTLNVTEAGFATLVVPFDAISISSGAEVYDLEVSGSDIVATEASGIHAGKPVLVKAPAGNYNVRSAYGAVKDFSGDLVNGALHGAYAETTIPAMVGGAYNYVLQNHSGDVAFYQLAADFTVRPNSAYLRATYNALAASPVAPRMRIVFQPQTPTAVENTDASECANRKVIVNGQLLIRKGQNLYTTQGQKLK